MKPKGCLAALQEYDDKREAYISSLEEEVEKCRATNVSDNEKQDKRYKKLQDLLLGKITAPEGLAFDNRDFQRDLVSLVADVVKFRERGGKSMDLEGYIVPYFPDTGEVHGFLDKSAGYPNHDSLEEAHAYVNQRKLWVNALLNELQQIF